MTLTYKVLGEDVTIPYPEKLAELDKVYHVSVPVGTVDSTGVGLICDLLRARVGAWGGLVWRDDGTYNEGSVETSLPDGWVWDWIVNGHGDYVGTLPKRLKKLAIKSGWGQVDAALLAQIGNIASAHSDVSGDYYVRLTRQIDWQAGDYGDDGSCWFGGGYDEDRYILAHSGGLGVQWVTSDGSGYARCWFLPVKLPGDAWGYVLFNAYHNEQIVKRQLHLLGMGRILAKWWGLDYRQIKTNISGLYVNGSDYVNGDSGHGGGKRVILGAELPPDLEVVTWNNPYGDTVDKFSWWADSHWNDCEDGHGYSRCDNCGRRVHNDDARFCNDSVYCESCAHEHISYCELGDHDVWDTETFEVTNGRGYHVQACDDCLRYDSNFAQCEYCNEWLNTGHDDYQSAGDDVYCLGCWDKLGGFVCEKCEEGIVGEAAVEVYGRNSTRETWCHECVNYNHLAECSTHGFYHGYDACPMCPEQFTLDFGDADLITSCRRPLDGVTISTDRLLSPQWGKCRQCGEVRPVYHVGAMYQDDGRRLSGASVCEACYNRADRCKCDHCGAIGWQRSAQFVRFWAYSRGAAPGVHVICDGCGGDNRAEWAPLAWRSVPEEGRGYVFSAMGTVVPAEDVGEIG